MNSQLNVLITRRHWLWALATNNVPLFKILRNKVNHERKRCRKIYYENKVEGAPARHQTTGLVARSETALWYCWGNWAWPENHPPSQFGLWRQCFERKDKWGFCQRNARVFTPIRECSGNLGGRRAFICHRSNYHEKTEGGEHLTCWGTRQSSQLGSERICRYTRPSDRRYFKHLFPEM